MAKLKARNRIELLRLVKENIVENDESIKWRRYTRCYMSDGNVLEKYDVRFTDDRFHSYGWKRKGKMLPDMTIPYIADRFMDAGWTIAYMSK